VSGNIIITKGRLQKNKNKKQLEFSNWALDPPPPPPIGKKKENKLGLSCAKLRLNWADLLRLSYQ
jgi:hypothetical protein